MLSYASRDGVWRVQRILLNSRETLRVTKNTPSGLSLHSDGLHRQGPVQMATGWWWAGDITVQPIDDRKAALMTAWAGVADLGVPLEDLEEEHQEETGKCAPSPS